MAAKPHAGPEVEAGTSWLAIVVIGLAQILLLLNTTALTFSIEGIVESLHAPAASVKTAIVTYSLVVAALIIVGAKVGQLLGARRVFRASVAVFAVAMTVMALSPDITSVVIAQLIAGVATAALMPTLIVLVADNYHGTKQAKALGWLGAAQSMGIVPALLIAGALGTWPGWRYTFGLQVPVALAVYLLSARLRPVPNAARVEIDAVGVVLLTLAIFMIGVGCNNVAGWGPLLATPRAPFSLLRLSPAPLVVVGGALLIRALLVWSRRRQAAGKVPLLVLDVFNTSQERCALFSMFAIGVIGAAITFVVPLYIEVVQGRNSLYTAVAVMPFALAGSIAAIGVVRLGRYTHPRRIARYAFLAVASGTALLGATIQNGWTNVLVIIGMMTAGIGEGALGALLFKLLAARRSEGDVEPLCGSAEYLALGVGTALVGALVTGVLAMSVQRELAIHSDSPSELKMQLDLDSVAFVSNDHLFRALSRTGATPEQIEAAVRINEQARLHALQVSFFTLGGLALLSMLPAVALPDSLREETEPEAGPSPVEGPIPPRRQAG